MRKREVETLEVDAMARKEGGQSSWVAVRGSGYAVLSLSLDRDGRV